MRYYLALSTALFLINQIAMACSGNLTNSCESQAQESCSNSYVSDTCPGYVGEQCFQCEWVNGSCIANNSCQYMQ